ncbi:helix-turn-helix domain-containing protein [uncultured Shewanella sp.]|uniref:helix-turn-helix domain-containing protein n=1 Tax=uncultured Shewanella sp. TaxID=173975 RepID=UPI002617D7B7|nr:helix-turn-helix domain-containing protein [uncultured Shewanella sp.]
MSVLTPLPSAEEIALAKLSSREMSAILQMNNEAQAINLMTKDGQSHVVTLPSSAMKLMIEILTQLGQGNSVSITPIHAELTTQEGADLLNMSRPTFIKLLDSNIIAHTRKGNRRKVAFGDVQSYKESLEKKRLESLNELSSLDQELGMGY